MVDLTKISPSSYGTELYYTLYMVKLSIHEQPIWSPCTLSIYCNFKVDLLLSKIILGVHIAGSVCGFTKVTGHTPRRLLPSKSHRSESSFLLKII